MFEIRFFTYPYKIKNLLTSPTIAKPFDDAKETILLTNASRLHGLGYALVQKSRKGELSLIQCGSRSLIMGPVCLCASLMRTQDTLSCPD